MHISRRLSLVKSHRRHTHTKGDNNKGECKINSFDMDIFVERRELVHCLFANASLLPSLHTMH
jgi:hypothetical protein